jgi:Kef-type K+ transport system membrane component KefB
MHARPGGESTVTGFEHTFYEIAALLTLAAVLGSVALLLRQPLIVAFIAVGILAGPSALSWVEATGEVDLLASLGIALLLFVVGLKLDLHLIRTLGPVALATGLGQVLFTSVVGYVIAIALGLTPVAALYVAVALTFSSTIIIVKLLSDKREIDSLHGRIAIGFLIVQDICVVIVMIGLTAFGSGQAADSLGVEMGMVLLKGLLFLGMIALAMRYVLPRILERLAHSPELLLLFSIAWAVSLAATGEELGFSMEVGAFLAGVAIASTPYREAIASRLVSLRDFLLLFFFIALGAGLDLSLLGAQVGAALVLSLFVLIGNPLIVIIIMGMMGYRRRTGFLCGLTVAQISEFSLILGALGLSLGHIGDEDMGLITLVGLITISASTYMILYSHPLYERLSPWLRPFERKEPFREISHERMPADPGYDVLLFGLGRFGTGIAQGLQARDVRTLGVDFDPEAVRACNAGGFVARFGDASDPEFLATLPLARLRWVISTVREPDVSLALLHGLRQAGYRGAVAVTVHTRQEEQRMRDAGADHVLLPFADAAREAAEQVAARLGTEDEGRQ